MTTEQPTTDRGALVGKMTCQTCGKVFRVWEKTDRAVLGSLLDLHMHRHQLEAMAQQR